MTIYLDYQATTPLAPEALAAMQPWLGAQFANPHSPHRDGRAAAAAIEVARDQIAALLPKGGRLFFTSGATEALNWALRCTAGGGLAIGATEHAAVRDTALWLAGQGRALTELPVDPQGLIDPAPALPQGTGLVAAMLVNNEIGVIQPVAQLAAAAHRTGALFLCDAVQGYGRMALPDGPDLIAISAHKIHGPKGIGALWVRDGVAITPLLHGGGQEGGLRSGTLSPALCVGFGAAAQLAATRMVEDAAHIERLWQIAMTELPQGWTINGSTEARYKGNLNLRRPGLDVARLISGLRDIAFSAGSACASGSGRPSHVLRALGLRDADANSAIRLGFGRYTQEADLRLALRAIFEAADQQRQATA
ncbi:MAG: cysteine desulfurase family protein [Chakrabartia sp.]